MMKARWLAWPLLLLVVSCGQGEAGRVQLSLATDAEGEVLVLPPWAVLLRVSISGPGIERPIVQELALEGGVVQTVRIGNVPTGADRVLQISVLTESGWVAYYGTSAPFSVKAKSIAQITVRVDPAPGADDPPDSPSFALLVNDGATATASTEVTLELTATGVSEMAVSNIALDPVADCATFPFVPYDAAPFTFGLLAGDGPKVVYALVRDAAGYCSRLIASDPVLLDTTGPAINAALLQGTPRPPGTEDTVLGLAGATEPSATIEIFSEEELLSLVASTTADDAGAFAPQSIGDNYTDEAGAGLVGQSTFHFIATDALGNRGAKVTWQTDVTPPEIDVSSFTPAMARRGVTLNVRVHAKSQLATPPEVRLTGYLGGALGEAFDCDTFDAVSSAYLCTYATTGVEPEGAMTIVAIGTKPGAGNIARVEGGPVIFDYTPPDLTFSASDLVLTMNPSPTPDTLFVPPGTLEPNSTLIIYNAWGSSFGACGDHEVYAELLVDSAGGISHASLGDDIVEGMARARSVDEAGNDPCDPSCLPGDPICCPEGGIDIATCSSFVSLCNDASPPSTYPIAYPEQVISSRTATIYALASDSSCPGVTSVALTECQLDGGAFAPCMPSITYDDLALGPHIWSVRSVDTVGNTEYAYEHEFRVQRRTTLYDTYALGSLQNWSYEDLTQKAYLADDAGVGHLFVGGEALWHFYDDGGGFAAEEIFRAPAMIPVAVSAGGNFHVLFASMDGSSLLLAEGETGAWEIEIVARPYNVLGGIDLAIDGTGATHVAYSTCSSTTCTGSSASVFILRREADGSWTTLDAAPNAVRAKSPRLLFDSEDNLWLATVRHESALHVLAMACRKEGVWDAAIELASPPAALATGLLDHFPTFTLTGGTSPLLRRRPGRGDL